MLLSFLAGVPASFALARYRFRYKEPLAFLFMSFRFAPFIAFLIPLYILFQRTGLYNTYSGLIFAYQIITLPFTIWMLRSFFKEVPREIEEAAMMDGAGRLQSFLRVIVPITWPGIITTCLFTLLLAYNEFLLARILTQSNWTLPVAIAQYRSGEDASHLTVAAAGSISITLPIIFVIIVFQKYLVKGLASGAVKG